MTPWKQRGIGHAVQEIASQDDCGGVCGGEFCRDAVNFLKRRESYESQYVNGDKNNNRSDCWSCFYSYCRLISYQVAIRIINPTVTTAEEKPENQKKINNASSPDTKTDEKKKTVDDSLEIVNDIDLNE